MSSSIHCWAEKKINGKWKIIKTDTPFKNGSYSIFAFLSGTRNYSAITPIIEPRGIPEDCEDFIKSYYEYWENDAHFASYLLFEELSKFDYGTICEDRRVNGRDTCDAGDGVKMSFKKFLGSYFFKELKRLKSIGAERIVFWFD